MVETINIAIKEKPKLIAYSTTTIMTNDANKISK